MVLATAQKNERIRPAPCPQISYLPCCSRSARGARADLHAPKAPKSKAEMEAEAAAEELMAKHREVVPTSERQYNCDSRSWRTSDTGAVESFSFPEGLRRALSLFLRRHAPFALCHPGTRRIAGGAARQRRYQSEKGGGWEERREEELLLEPRGGL